MVASPKSIDELMRRAHAIAGCQIGDIAANLSCQAPRDLLRDKGWLGQLLELQLGAHATSKALPDFPDLGVELKTIPIDALGRPTESTFVCVVQLLQLSQTTWQQSLVYNKLKCVLWIPIIDDANRPLLARHIATPLLWSPSCEQFTILQDDWQQLTDLIALGRIDEITAHMGQALQIRPKAANANARCHAIGETGERIESLPRGFYLRSRFTRAMLQEHFIV